MTKGINGVKYNGLELTLAIMKLLNSGSDHTDIIQAILKTIQLHTNFEAAGIRLKENEDYPYYTTVGFPSYFVEAERHLCARDTNSRLIREEGGSVMLECMCGNIIRGKTDPALPFFTEYGSFWSNCTSQLLANTDEKERQSKTRNRCNAEGYESVALIPLHNEKEIIGLLQLNDTRTGMFTKEDIAFFEKLGDSIGVALTIRQNEKKMYYMNICLEQEVNKKNDRIQTLLKENQLLIKHMERYMHGSLNIIYEILNSTLENSTTDAPLMKESLESIEFMNKLLFDKKYLSQINIDTFLKDIINHLLMTFGNQTIDYIVNTGNTHLGINSALIAGFFVTRITQNFLNRIFTKGEKHLIKIDFTFNTNLCLLKIYHTGAPGQLKDHQQINKMIEKMTRRMGGNFSFTSEKGIQYNISFTRNKENINIPGRAFFPDRKNPRTPIF